MTTYIYRYSKNTNEYLGKQIAEADPEETKIKGEFVPLVPANATTIEPPVVNKGHVAVFENNEWQDKLDYRNYYLVDESLTVTEIKTIDKPDGIVVNKDFADKIKSNPNDYKIEDNQVVEKTEEDKIKIKEQQFNELFFNTSLGYIKRSVTFKDGKTANFLTDIVPLLEIDTPIITYNKPIFENEETPSQNRDVKVTEVFLKECKMQLLTDFWGNEV